MNASQPSSSSTNLMGKVQPLTPAFITQPFSNLSPADTHNRLIADILTRYRTLMMLATVQAEDERNNATPETMAVAGISMKMEFDGLVKYYQAKAKAS